MWLALPWKFSSVFGWLYHESSVRSCLIFWNTVRKPKIRLGNMEAFGTTDCLPFDRERLRVEFQFFFRGGLLVVCWVGGKSEELWHCWTLPVRTVVQIKSGCGQSPGGQKAQFLTRWPQIQLMGLKVLVKGIMQRARNLDCGPTSVTTWCCGFRQIIWLQMPYL